jgi:hypothetical protein
MWWKRHLDMKGLIFFRGSLAPSLEGLDGIAKAGISVEVAKTCSDEVWAANLRHESWGRARLSARRCGDAPSAEFLVRYATGITESERETIARDAQSALALEMPAPTGDVLRDRKRFLRFLSAVLGTEGIAGLDVLAETFWTPGRLSDELQHDAALDIIQVHVLHVVTQLGGLWLHSHGLAEMGFVDFDVLRPAEALTGNQFDLLRSIAFLIVEGASAGLIEPAIGAEPVALVDANTFMRSASSSDTELRDPEGHSDRRVVCCDAASPGFIGRLFRSKGIRPSPFLCRGMTEGRHLIRFSNGSTDLTAARARESLSMLEPLREEFEDLQCTTVVKMGYPTDSGDNGSEHLWFEVHGIRGDFIDATLLNEPFDIASMKAGNRDMRSVELLTDWSIMTPIGQLTPRSLEVARKLRENRPKIQEFLRSRI